MKYYELTYLISTYLPAAEISSAAKKISDLIQQEGGEIKTLTPPEKRKLAYSIKKENTAFLGILDFNLAPDKLAGFEKELKDQKEILRYTILSKSLPKLEKTRRRIILKKMVEIEKPLVSEKARDITEKEESSLSSAEALAPDKKKIPEGKKKKVGLKEIGEKLEEILGE